MYTIGIAEMNVSKNIIHAEVRGFLASSFLSLYLCPILGYTLDKKGEQIGMEYYVKIERDEHLLYTKEIAEMLFNRGWTTRTGKSPVAFLNAVLNEGSRVLKQDEIFYNTRNGLKRVWPSIVLERFLEVVKKHEEDEDTELLASNNGKSYYISRNYQCK